MKISLLAFLLLPFFSYASEQFICSAQYVDKTATPPKTLGIKEKEFAITESGNRYSVASLTSNYSSTFITQKDSEGSAYGFDNYKTLFMKNPDGIYSLTFSEPSMKNVFIALINCYKHD